MRNLVDRFQNLRYFFLLISVLTLITVSPFFAATESDRSILGLLFTLVLLSAVHTSSAKPRQFVFAVSLAIPWLILQWGGDALGLGESKIATGILLAALNGFAIFIVLGHIINEKDVKFNILCGAVAIYLMLGLSWALVFSVLEAISPGTIALSNTNAELAWIDLLYFSFTTLTTLGYGDITPISPVARIWANLEAITGTLYIAVLVARLVSLYRD